jgi:hypothetical protein
MDFDRLLLTGIVLSMLIVSSSLIAQTSEEADCDLTLNAPSIENAHKYFSTINHKCVVIEINNLLNAGPLEMHDELEARILMIKSYYLDDINDAIKYNLVTAQFDTVLDLNPYATMPEKPKFDSIYILYYNLVQDSIIKSRINEGRIQIEGGPYFTFPSGDFKDYYNTGSGFYITGLFRYKKLKFGPLLEYIVHSRDLKYSFFGADVHDQSKTSDFIISVNARAYVLNHLDSILFPYVFGGLGLSFTQFEFDLDYIITDRTFEASKSVTKLFLRFGIGTDLRLNRYWGMQIRLGRLTKTDFTDDDAKKSLPRFDENAESCYFLSLGVHFKP